MPKFGKDSTTKLSSCHPDLQRLFNEVIKNYDCKILEGYRSAEDQLNAFNAGRSQIKSGGKHNNSPSLAIDVAPVPIDWNDKNSFYHFAGYVCGTAQIEN